MTRAAILRDLAGLLVAAAAAAAIVAAGPVPGEAVAIAAVVLIAGWIVWQDASDFTIPDGAVLALAVVAGAVRLGVDGAPVALVLLDAVLAGGALWLLREVFYRRRGFDGLGFGDVKLAAAGSMLVGLTAFAAALLAASLAGLLFAAARGAPAVAAEGEAPPHGPRIAFGVALAPAIAVAFVAARLGLLPAALLPAGG
jgi:prepilin signal peptidase PulO-like enzyme (type II secretory pathway)